MIRIVFRWKSTTLPYFRLEMLFFPRSLFTLPNAIIIFYVNYIRSRKRALSAKECKILQRRGLKRKERGTDICTLKNFISLQGDVWGVITCLSFLREDVIQIITTIPQFFNFVSDINYLHGTGNSVYFPRISVRICGGEHIVF